MPTAPEPRRRRRAIAARVGVGLVIAVAVVHSLRRAGDVVRDALATITEVRVGVLVALVACFLVERAARARTVQASLPGSTWVQGAVLNEVGSATSGGIPAGGAIGAGVRVAMARSWGHAPAPSWLSIAGANESFSIATRLLAIAVLAPEFVGGSADLTDWGITTVLVASLVASLGAWALLSRETRLLRWWRRTATSLHVRVCRRIRWGVLRRFDPVHWIDRFRDASAALLARPLALLVPAVGSHVIGGLLFFLALRGVGVDLDWVTVARIHFVGKVAAGFAPTPGGVGIVEAGLTAALVAAGAGEVDALAGVLLTRAFTYALPIGLGAAAVLGWRLHGRSERGEPAAEHGDEELEPRPVLVATGS